MISTNVTDGVSHKNKYLDPFFVDLGITNTCSKKIVAALVWNYLKCGCGVTPDNKEDAKKALCDGLCPLQEFEVYILAGYHGQSFDLFELLKKNEPCLNIPDHGTFFQEYIIPFTCGNELVPGVSGSLAIVTPS